MKYLEPERIHVTVISGNTVKNEEFWRNENFGGTYSYHSDYDDYKFFKVSFNVQKYKIGSSSL